MFGALVIVFREVIEAGLIIGIVLAATRGVSGRGQWVAGGVVAGALGAGIVALFAEAIADAFEGSGQELFNASVLGAAQIEVAVPVSLFDEDRRVGGCKFVGSEQLREVDPGDDDGRGDASVLAARRECRCQGIHRALGMPGSNQVLGIDDPRQGTGRVSAEAHDRGGHEAQVARLRSLVGAAG